MRVTPQEARLGTKGHATMKMAETAYSQILLVREPKQGEHTLIKSEDLAEIGFKKRITRSVQRCLIARFSEKGWSVNVSENGLTFGAKIIPKKPSRLHGEKAH